MKMAEITFREFGEVVSMVHVKGTPRQRWVRKSILTIEKSGLLQESTQEEVVDLVKVHTAAMEERLIRGWIVDDPRKGKPATVSHLLVGLDVEGLELMATVETAKTPTGYKLSRYLGKYGDKGLVLEGKFWREGDAGKLRALLEVNIKAHRGLFGKVETHHKRVRKLIQKGRRRHGKKVR